MFYTFPILKKISFNAEYLWQIKWYDTSITITGIVHKLAVPLVQQIDSEVAEFIIYS